MTITVVRGLGSSWWPSSSWVTTPSSSSRGNSQQAEASTKSVGYAQWVLPGRLPLDALRAWHGHVFVGARGSFRRCGREPSARRWPAPSSACSAGAISASSFLRMRCVHTTTCKRPSSTAIGGRSRGTYTACCTACTGAADDSKSQRAGPPHRPDAAQDAVRRSRGYVASRRRAREPAGRGRAFAWLLRRGRCRLCVLDFTA
jgi:hypothetical protein